MCLMIDAVSPVMHLIGDSPISITAMVRMEDLSDKSALLCPFVGLLIAAIIER